MKEIELLNPAAHEHLMERDPKTWSRAFFRFDSMCDAVENGVSESFNSVIVEARKKPIITMLEEIRTYVMERMHKLQMKGCNWPDYQVCPAIRHKINELKIHQRYVYVGFHAT